MDSKCSSGGRRRHTRKSRKTRKVRRTRHSRRGGFAPASFQGVVTGANGQPAGAQFGAVGVSTSSPNTNASNYTGAADTSAGYSGGRRRRGRKSRKTRRHRMRGGTGGQSVGYGFAGESVGGTAVGRPVWGPVSASTHETDAAGYNRGW